MAIKWQDKREVHMLTSIHKDGLGSTKKVDHRTGDIIKKPLAIIDYNAYMGAVDKSDMQISFVECVRKSIKWYKKFFFHLLDMTVFNSCIMYELKTGKKHNLNDYRKQLIREIIEKYGTYLGTGRRTSSFPDPKRLTDRHIFLR